ncbi:hypothetical protein GOP47_0011207 [Adiantum capillus-veneris]|uniref:IST1-like protein n=1 Tax=Adiantum capillus-veneris TaxID=13818 RepID=A0A9D4ZF66_ADICA|nr:hypothetical protein GOP47_0011207 [Adiantum capillus-veneris]
MLRSVFGKSFNAGKCKTLLRLGISRIKLLKNKRDMQVKHMRRELGQLLHAKQELTARIRVEHVFREQNILAAYEIIELFSELLVVRLPIIESQKQCPIDLREAIASLIFAAPRCADLPELQDISSVFAVKYGKDFVAAAAELRPDCGVNRLVIEKLSVRAPSGEVRLKLMKEIAEEQGVDWDAAEFEAELHKPSEDLLDGPDRFMKATQGSFQAPLKDLSTSLVENEEMENDEVSAPFTLPDPPSGCHRQSFSPPDPPSGCHRQSFSPKHKKNTQESGPKREESYKDAADAARAAALSAERAAAAAIAVASLAKENFTRMPSNKISNRSTPESSSASDEDDSRKETTMQENVSPATSDYFKIRMDSFDAHLNRARSDSHDGREAGFAKPVFDEYPEDRQRYSRMQTGGNRKQAVVDAFSSDEDESDSTERSDSPPLQRGGRVDGYPNSRQAGFGSDIHRSSGTHVHDDDDNGFHYHETARQSRGSARKGNGVGPPPQRPPPTLAHNEHFSAQAAPHVHPKLPDYDDLSARFGALKSRN